MGSSDSVLWHTFSDSGSCDFHVSPLLAQCCVVLELSIMSIRYSFISLTHFKDKSGIFTEMTEMAV